MMRLRKHVILASTCLAVAGCSVAPPLSTDLTTTTLQKPRGSAASQADGATGETFAAAQGGLKAADADVKPSQFQFQGPDGGPLEGVRVTIAKALLSTNARGVVDLPDAVLKGEASITALVTAPGYVPGYFRLEPGKALALQPIDARRTAVTAAAGATVSNAAGDMEVVFPPGALSQNANVAVTRSFSEHWAQNVPTPEYLPLHVLPGYDAPDSEIPWEKATGFPLKEATPLGAYGYHLELGEAKITPGAAVKVRFKAEEELAAAIEENPGFFEGEGARQDQAGNWWFEMAVPAPAAPPPQPLVYELLKKGGGGGGGGKGGGGGSKPAPPPPPKPPASKPAPASPPKPPKSAEVSKVGKATVIEFDSKKEAEAYLKQVEKSLKNESVKGFNDSKHKGKVEAAAGEKLGGFVVHSPQLNNGHCTYIVYPTKKKPSSGGGTAVPVTPSKPGTAPTAPSQPSLPPALAPWTAPPVSGQPAFSPPVSVNTEVWVTGKVTAKVVWDSDIPELDGQPVQGAFVSFSHAGTPTHDPTTSGYTNAAGLVEAFGAEYAPGFASAVWPSQASVNGTADDYTINYGQFELQLIKKRPRVTLQWDKQGTPGQASYSVATNLGAFNVEAANNPVVSPTFGLTLNNTTFKVAGATQPAPNQWAEFESGNLDVSWNATLNLATKAWFSTTVETEIRYQSDDSSVPADQRPSTRWHGQPATGANVTFSHPVSGYSAKPAGRDQLSFSDVSTAKTWGLSGAAGSSTASRAGAEGTTFSGSGTYVVSGGVFNTSLLANLPTLSVDIQAESDIADKLEMVYKLDGVEKTMRLPKPTNQRYRVSLPIEETVNAPGVHRFELVHIHVTGAPDWHAFTQDMGLTFPAVEKLHRNKDVTYPVKLKIVANAPK
ncbi:MAG: hypothetical protein VKP62_11315 [Candidatus Sericytochromatia bacterium]|nr:hypothetical protein [Candidatus Sericytochromatia bacterium]